MSVKPSGRTVGHNKRFFANLLIQRKERIRVEGQTHTLLGFEGFEDDSVSVFWRAFSNFEKNPKNHGSSKIEESIITLTPLCIDFTSSSALPVATSTNLSSKGTST